jgi:hypothetical protein
VANPNPPRENLRPQPWKPGQSGNPKGSSRRARAQAALFKLFGEEKLDEWINRALVAKGLDMDEIALKKPNGKPRDPELAALLALREWAYGKLPTPKTEEDSEDPEEPQATDEHGNLI